MTPIIARALLQTVTDIGQLTADDKKTLAAYVKKGWLSKGLGGGYPKVKTVYAHPGFDFVADRKFQLDQLFKLA